MKQYMAMHKQLGLVHLGWVALIAATVLLTSIVFYLFQFFSSTADNRRSAKIFEQSLIASINQYEYLPALLGRDELVLKLLKNEQFEHVPVSHKLEFIAARSGADDIFLQNEQGTVVATSNFRRPGHNFYGRNYSFRPYFQLAKSERSRQFYFAKGATTGIPGFFISAPVIDAGKVLGVVVVKLELGEWEQNWRDSNDNIAVADANGIVILSSEDDWRYRSISALPENQLQEIYRLKQFPGETHEPLSNRQLSLDTFGFGSSYYWTISRNAYMVSAFPIADTQWTLYHLVEHQRILASALAFLAIASLFGLAVYMLLREREHRIRMRRQARVVERERRQELQRLIDNIHIGVLVFDHDGVILSMNDHAEHLLLAGNEFRFVDADIRVTDLIDIDIAGDRFDRLLLEDISTPAYHETTALGLSAADAETRAPVMFAVGQVQFADQQSYLMTVINITKRKDVENELVRLNESLEETVEARTQELRDTQKALMQKNKTVALGNMAATIVHELSQPLAAINSSVAAIQTKMQLQNWQGAGESARRLVPLGQKMNNVIKLLKFYSYQDDSLVEDITLSNMVRQAVDVLQDRFQEKSIDVQLFDHCPDAKVRVNPIKIDLAISNLLKNAIEAVETNKKPLITIRSSVMDNSISLQIEDNGGGVDDHIMGQLFNPYFTTKEVGKGMGLGLSITYEIIQEYDGRISAKNTSQGACFSISLPLLSVGADQQLANV